MDSESNERQKKEPSRKSIEQEIIDNLNKAVQCNPKDHKVYSNRAAYYLSIKEFHRALSDAQKCIQMNPSWVGGHKLEGDAYFGLQEFQLAIYSYQQGLKYDKKNKQLKQDIQKAQEQQLKACEKILNTYMKLASNEKMREYLSDPKIMKEVFGNPQSRSDNQKVQQILHFLNSSDDQNFYFSEMINNMKNSGYSRKQKEVNSQSSERKEAQSSNVNKKQIGEQQIMPLDSAIKSKNAKNQQIQM